MIPMLAALAMLAGGAYVQKNAADKANDARKRVTRREIDRQNKYQGEANEIFQKSLDASTVDTVGQQIEDAQAERVGAYEQINAEAPALLEQLRGGGGTGGNQVVANEHAAQSSLADIFAGNQARAKAKLSAFGDSMFQGNVDRARGNQNLSMVGNLAQGSQTVSEFEDAAAAHSRDGEKLFGSLISQLGAMALGASAPAVGATGASTVSTASAAGNPGFGSALYNGLDPKYVNWAIG